MELAAFRLVRVPTVITPTSALEIAAEISEASVDSAVRGIVIEGGPKEFCRGMDLSTLERRASPEPSGPHAGIRAFADALCLLTQVKKPTVAMVRGAVLGGGLGLAAACDVVLATHNATFGLPEGLFGLAPAVIAPILLGRITPAHFRRLALTAESIPARAAQAIGLVDEIVEDEASTARLRRTLASLLRVHPRTKGVLLEAARWARESTLTASIEWAVEETSRASRSADAAERIGRFLEGGAPWQP